MRFFIFFLLMLIPFSARADGVSLDIMAGQMLMAGFRGDHLSDENPIVADIRDRHLGGVVLFDYDVALGRADRNVKSPAQVRELISSLEKHAAIPLLVAVDQEGGRVQRLKAKWGFPETPSAEELGKRGPGACRTAGSLVGRTLADTGFNMDYAPVVDVNVNPDSPAIGAIGRSFSADPELVASDAAAFIKGLSAHGIISCLKHFPGHGSASSDSHLGVTDVTRTWSQAELVPYRRLIENGFDGMIMTAHVFNARLDPDHPATLSKKIITGILRDRLGWDGVVITDDMDMKAVSSRYGMRESIRLAILAGADIILYGNNLRYDPEVVARAHRTIMELVESGEISEERIRQSHARISALKNRLR